MLVAVAASLLLRAKLPRLETPVSLTYRVATVDLRTLAMRNKSLTDLRKSYAGSIKRGQITQAEVDRIIKTVAPRIQRPTPPAAGRVRLSILGSRIHFRYDLGGHGFDALYDGHYTYRIGPDSSEAVIAYPGLRTASMINMPLVGVDLPGLPLTRAVGGRTLVLFPNAMGGGADPLVYTDGSLVLGSDPTRPRLEKLTITGPFGPSDVWRFADHRPYGSVQLPHRITVTDYGASGPGEPSSKPVGEARFVLEKVTRAEPPNAFDLKAYVKPGRVIQFVDLSGGRTRVVYDPAAGTAAAQIERRLSKPSP